MHVGSFQSSDTESKKLKEQGDFSMMHWKSLPSENVLYICIGKINSLVFKEDLEREHFLEL